jgi:hypothetical protein
VWPGGARRGLKLHSWRFSLSARGRLVLGGCERGHQSCDVYVRRRHIATKPRPAQWIKPETCSAFAAVVVFMVVVTLLIDPVMNE